uniref:Loricrin-like n=1 Tax=Nicotiana tabacum TaxID=4097 RepID=A0A1S3Y3X7_TOBAC|nr:PREDICTED: loricrin-like [Nicotiana tabacum]
MSFRTLILLLLATVLSSYLAEGQIVDHKPIRDRVTELNSSSSISQLLNSLPIRVPYANARNSTTSMIGVMGNIETAGKNRGQGGGGGGGGGGNSGGGGGRGGSGGGGGGGSGGGGSGGGMGMLGASSARQLRAPAYMINLFMQHFFLFT